MASELDQALALIDFNALTNTIGACASVQDFVNIYDSRQAQLCLSCLRKAIAFDPAHFDRAREWAIRMRQQPPPPRDLALNECCRSMLQLIFALIDRWRDGTIATEEIVNNFAVHRLVNILQVTLPMDRATCLYTMRYPGSANHGMHWIAPQHVNRLPNWQEVLNRTNGFPTMNERYLWLIENPVFEQHLQDHSIIRPCLELVQNPHLDDEDVEGP